MKRKDAGSNTSAKSNSSQVLVETKSPPAKSKEDAEARFREYFSDTERVEHDLNLEHVTDEGYWVAKQFIHACEKVGVWRLKQGELTEDAGYHLGLLARELAESIRALIAQGDVMLARQLPPVVDILQSALSVYGTKVTGSSAKRLSIEQILKKHPARELLAILSALHPDWHLWLLHIYHPKIRQLPEDKRGAILLSKRRKIELFPEEQLQKLILSKELFVGWKDGKPTEEWRRHGLAAILENVFAVRQGENENINLFVEHLWRGQLWSGPGPTFQKCAWHGKKDLPVREDVGGWMKIVMPFLRRVTQDDAMKLGVFDHLIAARKAVYVGNKEPEVRLANDKTDYVWNQVRTRIAQAWKTMAIRARKRNSGKPA